ncbi:MAG: hypothetical protein KF850_20225 [Labilithrix sp.]|nr:hypothetical protein [Labilithrix sp.]
MKRLGPASAAEAPDASVVGAAGMAGHAGDVSSGVAVEDRVAGVFPRLAASGMVSQSPSGFELADGLQVQLGRLATQDHDGVVRSERDGDGLSWRLALGVEPQALEHAAFGGPSATIWTCGSAAV